MKTNKPIPSEHEGATQPRTLNIEYHTVLGHRLRVAIWPGAKNKVPLLLFNGIGAGFELVTPFIDELDPSIEVIVFDVPGTGESPAPRVPYRMWMLAAMASRLVHALGHDRVDVMGVSWGGALAQQFALQNPRLCRRLILAATSQGTLMVPGRLSALTALMSPRRYNDPEYRQKIFGTIYGGKAAKDPSLISRFGRQMRPTSRKGYLLQQLAQTTDPRHRWGRRSGDPLIECQIDGPLDSQCKAQGDERRTYFSLVQQHRIRLPGGRLSACRSDLTPVKTGEL
jgi:poly(3-hydroxyalkanoate) depolymerase